MSDTLIKRSVGVQVRWNDGIRDMPRPREETVNPRYERPTVPVRAAGLEDDATDAYCAER